MSNDLRDTVRHASEVSIPDEIRTNPDVQAAARNAALKYLQKTELEKAMYKKYKDAPAVVNDARSVAEAESRMVISSSEDHVTKVVKPAWDDLQKMKRAEQGVLESMALLRTEVTKEAKELGITNVVRINEIANALEFNARPKRESALSK